MRGWFHGAVGALLFAAMAQLAHHAPPGLSAWGLVFHRALAGLVLLTPAVLPDVRALVTPRAWRLWRRGALGALAIFFYFVNLRRTSAGMATVLHQAAPIFVALLSPLVLHVRTSGKALLGCTIAVIGVALLVSPSGQSLDPGSLVIGLTGALIGGFAYLSLKSASDTFGATALVWALSVFLFLLSLARFDAAWLTLGAREWVFAVGVGVLSVLAQIFMSLSYRELTAPTAATLTLTSAVWALVYDLATGDMILNGASTVGVLAILGGLAMTHHYRNT